MLYYKNSQYITDNQASQYQIIHDIVYYIIYDAIYCRGKSEKNDYIIIDEYFINR